MKYKKTVRGIFLDRPNRFIAHAAVDGKTETVHVKNTGRCKELLIPGCIVILEDFRNRKGFETRKTSFDLIAVYKNIEKNGKMPATNSAGTDPCCFGKHTSLGTDPDDFEKHIDLGTAPQSFVTTSTGTDPSSINNFPLIFSSPDSSSLLINMDSQAPNKVVYEWLCSLPQQTSFDYIKPEYTFGKSRIDFYMEKNNQKYLMEVKGCTLEKNGTGYFPDAPTERGVKHLHELAAAYKSGYKCYIAFVIQIPGVKEVLPNIETHAEFGKALEEAKAAGVVELFLPCKIMEDELSITADHKINAAFG